MEKGSLQLYAPAKVNLTLEVLARRADGYHGIRSLMVPLALYDELSIEASPAGFSFSCSESELSTSTNLVVRAFEAIAGTHALPSLDVYLTKRIPTQSGLGGGSSDAASILVAASERSLDFPKSAHDWLAVARSLGSDVPFFLTKTGALVEGTGERVTAVGTLPKWHALIVRPPVAISTAAAYSALDARPHGTRARSGSVSLQALAALQRGDFEEVLRYLSNDFHALMTATYPEIAQTIDALHAAGATNALLAGSGSCVFTLTRDRRSANAIAEKLSLPSEFTIYLSHLISTPAWNARVS